MDFHGIVLATLISILYLQEMLRLLCSFIRETSDKIKRIPNKNRSSKGSYETPSNYW